MLHLGVLVFEWSDSLFSRSLLGLRIPTVEWLFSRVASGNSRKEMGSECPLFVRACRLLAKGDLYRTVASCSYYLTRCLTVPTITVIIMIVSWRILDQFPDSLWRLLLGYQDLSRFIKKNHKGHSHMCHRACPRLKDVPCVWSYVVRILFAAWESNVLLPERHNFNLLQRVSPWDTLSMLWKNRYF